MEIYEVVGFREVDIEDEKGHVQGYSLYLTSEPKNDNVVGFVCEKVFIRSRYVSYRPQLGDRIRLIYNRYGKIGAVETC